MQKIILFDGECHFCNRSVQFIIKRDPSALFKFTSLQSTIGKNLVNQFNIPPDIDSLLLINNGKWHTKSSAVFHICKYLSGPWKLFYPFLIIPKPIRDFFYHIIAKNRYKFYRKQSICMIPTQDMKQRFL